MATLYDALGLPLFTADPAVIKRAFVARALAAHPDKGLSNAVALQTSSERKHQIEQVHLTDQGSPALPKGLQQQQQQLSHSRDLFEAAHAAFSVLRDPQKRAAYDAQLRARNLGRMRVVNNAGPASASASAVAAPSAHIVTAVHDEADLDDFTVLHDVDKGIATYTYPCRCGGEYALTDDDLDAGITILECPDCSLSLRVLYEEAL